MEQGDKRNQVRQMRTKSDKGNGAKWDKGQMVLDNKLDYGVTGGHDGCRNKIEQ